MKLKKFIDEATADKEKTIQSLEKRVLKVGERAHKLTITRFKLEDELEKIQKIMKKKGIDEIRGLEANEDVSQAVGNMMA